MPPRRRAPVPIPIDIEAVRRKLADGKIVRVGISRSAQFPEGGTGRVRHVGSPEVDGEEYVQVELSLNGTRDILPFTPADLTPATRAKATTPEPAATEPAMRPRPARAPSAPPVPRPTAPAAVGAGTTGEPDTVPPTPPADPTPQASRGTASLSGTAPSVGAPSGSRGTTRAKGPKGQRRSPPVSITIATTETEPTHWRIEARVGARVVLRSGSVSPARVWELVQQLAEPTLMTAVGGILDEQRKAAQARADALAAELAQVQAELDLLPRSR